MTHKIMVPIAPLHTERMLHIYVPDDIAQGERLPVVYMFDGHNLFYDEDSTYGKCWGVREFLENTHSRVIIVGIECNHEGNMRLWEFSPYSFVDNVWGRVKGLGKQFIDWMAGDLKRYIDANLPVLTDREHTAIAGSSMGGLMSIYGGAMRSDVFSKAGCLSPFYDHIFAKLVDDIERAHIYENSAFYLSWGRHEFSGKKNLAVGTEKNLIISRMLTMKGASVYPHMMVDGRHDEASWEIENPIWFSELGII